MSKKLNAEVEITGFAVRFLSGASIESIAVKPLDPDTAEPEAGVISLSEIKIDLFPASLVSGRYQPKRIEIENINADFNNQSFNWLFSLKPGKEISGKMPEIKVNDGSVRIEHRVLGKPLHVKDIKISGPTGAMIAVNGQINFGNKNNCLDLKMNWAPSFAQAEIRAENFDLSVLRELNMAGGIYTDLQTGFGEKLTGRLLAGISLKSSTVTLQNSFFNAGRASLEIFSGGLSFDRQAIERAWIRAEVKRINPEIVKDFVNNLQIKNFAKARIKQGHINIGGIASWNKDAGLDYRADVSLRDGSAYFPELKTAVNDMEAEIEVSPPARIKIRSSAGWVSNGKIEAFGFFDLRNKTVKDYRLELALGEITANKSMLVLLPENVREVVEDMQLQHPVVSGKIMLASQHAGVELEAKARRARMPGLPFTIATPASNIKWDSGAKKIYFNQCRGHINGGLLSGNVVLKYDGPVNADFNLHGRRLPINPEMLKWLELDKTPWMITGGYDIELRAANWRSGENFPAQALKKLQIKADLRDVAVYHPVYGKVADNWYGHLTMDEKGSRVKDFRGEIFGVGFHASGTIPEHELSKAHLSLESENIDLNEQLYGRLPFGEKIKKTGIKGQCELRAELDSLHGGWIPEKGSVSTVIHSLNSGSLNLQISTGGTARFAFTAPGAEKASVEGKFDMNRFSLGKFEANRLSGDFTYHDGRIKIPGMKINAYGGSIRLNNSIINTENGRWRTELLPVRMDLESIFAAFGITGENTPAGSLRGEIKLKGNRFNPEAVAGSGTIKVAHGILYDFPIFTSIFNVLDLQMPRQKPVTDAYGNFKIKNGKITINELLLTGGTAPMLMEGSVGLKKGKDFKEQSLELLITAAKTDGLLDRIPLINWIKHYTLDLFKRIAMQVRVEGTIGDYKVKRLSGPVTEPVEKMWGLMEKLTPSPPEK
ncbi:MAG: AsmA-like C-terminal region-containing protein [Desulfobacteraceae bacterium]|nr:AsmA-like C-terminal region-containing protein [Desulfobacteraceae bacterium]